MTRDISSGGPTIKTLVSLSNRNLVDQIEDVILTIIKENELEPGDPLPSQAELIEELGVGRTSLREAVQRLVALGAVEVTAGKRMAVGAAIEFSRYTTAAEIKDSLKRGTLRDIAEMRDLLEPEVAALAAESITEPQIHQLEQILKKMEAASEPSSALELNVRFHCLVAEATQNHAFLHVLKSAMDMLSPLHLQLYEQLHAQGIDFQAKAEHLPIVEALKEHDPVKAREAMRAHIEAFSNFAADNEWNMPKSQEPSSSTRSLDRARQ